MVLACALAISGTGVVASSALLSDSAASSDNTISTSSVTLGLTPAAQTYSVSLAPGEAFTTPVTVRNDGDVEMRYAVRGTSDLADGDQIASRLRFRAKTGVNTCTTAGYGATGTAVVGPVRAASTSGSDVLGNPAQGADDGDRTLAPGASEVLCMQILLPADQRGDIGGRAATVTYTFNAEQTVNN